MILHTRLSLLTADCVWFIGHRIPPLFILQIPPSLSPGKSLHGAESYLTDAFNEADTHSTVCQCVEFCRSSRSLHTHVEVLSLVCLCPRLRVWPRWTSSWQHTEGPTDHWVHCWTELKFFTCKNAHRKPINQCEWSTCTFDLVGGLFTHPVIELQDSMLVHHKRDNIYHQICNSKLNFTTLGQRNKLVTPT